MDRSNSQPLKPAIKVALAAFVRRLGFLFFVALSLERGSPSRTQLPQSRFLQKGSRPGAGRYAGTVCRPGIRAATRSRCRLGSGIPLRALRRT